MNKKNFIKIMIFGASGFIGQHLIRFFLDQSNIRGAENVEVVAVEHSTKIKIKDLSNGGVKKLKILGFSSTELEKELVEADVVINLSGANIADKPWTEQRKKVLWDSRVKTTETIKGKLIKAIQTHMELVGKNHPRDIVFINASAIGFYADFDHDGDVADAKETKNENSPKGNGFLSDLTDAWEKSARFSTDEIASIPHHNIRSVILRIGLVLGKEGGALPPIMLATKFFAGAIMGSGEQPVAWVAVKEVPLIIKHIIEQPVINGPVNVVAPQSVSFTYFVKQIGKYLKRPVFFKAPRFVLKLFLQQRADLILKGDNVYPSVLINNGYEFKYPNLPDALKALNT